VYHHYYLQRPDIGIPHVKIGIISKKQWKVADFYKRKLDSNIGNCIIISHLRQLNKNKVAESLDFTGVMPLFMFKRMLYGNTTLKFF